jgi:hypothetical protein
MQPNRLSLKAPGIKINPFKIRDHFHLIIFMNAMHKPKNTQNVWQNIN